MEIENQYDFDTKMELNNLKDFVKKYPQFIFHKNWELKIDCQEGPGYMFKYFWRTSGSIPWSTDESLNRIHNIFDNTDSGYDFIGWDRPGVLIFKHFTYKHTIKYDCILRKEM